MPVRFAVPLLGFLASTASIATYNSRSTTLQVLRTALDEIRTTVEITEPVTVPNIEEVALDSVVGATLTEIKASLGVPDSCGGAATCHFASEWQYQFFRLPAGWRGGGFSLLLMFDSAGKCTGGEWIGSR